MNKTAWIVYQPDWSGIEIYFDELKAYKAAVKIHAEVIRVGEGDVKEQAKNPRKFNQPENNHKEQQDNASKENQSGNRKPTGPSGIGQGIQPEPPKVNSEGLTQEQIEARQKINQQGDIPFFPGAR